jgi:hypothetical protein
LLSGAQHVICTVKLDEEKAKHAGLAQENVYFNFIDTLAGYLRKSKSWFQSLELFRVSIG